MVKNELQTKGISEGLRSRLKVSVRLNPFRRLWHAHVQRRRRLPLRSRRPLRRRRRRRSESDFVGCRATKGNRQRPSRNCAVTGLARRERAV